MMSKLNCFVQTSIDILACHDGEPAELAELASLLGEREPMLSPFNAECAAREALRVWPEAERELRALERERAAAEAAKEPQK